MEQQRLVGETARRLCIDRKLDDDVDTNLERAEALRQSILAKAFSLSNDDQSTDVDGLLAACA